MDDTLPTVKHHEDLHVCFKIRGVFYHLRLPGRKLGPDEEPDHQTFSVDFDIKAQVTNKFDLFEYLHSKPHVKEVALVEVLRYTHCSPQRPIELDRLVDVMQNDIDDWREPRTEWEIRQRRYIEEMKRDQKPHPVFKKVV